LLALNIVIAIVLLLTLITLLKIHPFVALLLVSFWVGLFAKMPLVKITEAVQAGFGNTLGFIGIVLGLGTMLGKLLEESGGAERIARTLIVVLGPQRVHWAMYMVAFIVGIPLFFQVGFVLLIPLVYTITKELKIPALKVGLPMLAGLSVVHGILPPHPAALASLDIFKADIGKTIIYGLVVGLPASILAGPLFGRFISSKLPSFAAIQVTEFSSGPRKKRQQLPGFFLTLFTIFLPVLLLLLATYADITMEKTHELHPILKFIGNPITALLIALVVAFYTFGLSQKMTLASIQKYCDESLLLIASILLILGAGGAFSKVLVESGVGAHVAETAKSVNINPILFGWLVATLIRVATGSATVAMTTASGIVAPLTAQTGVSPELMVLATGGGALMLSHVNDAGFWLIKGYFKMSLKQTFLTWTLLETILGTAILVFTLILERVLTFF
jgi:gluconate:H+ symporter, GntP family